MTCETKAYVDDVLVSSTSAEVCGTSSEINDHEGTTTTTTAGVTGRTEVSCD